MAWKFLPRARPLLAYKPSFGDAALVPNLPRRGDRKKIVYRGLDGCNLQQTKEVSRNELENELLLKAS